MKCFFKWKCMCKEISCIHLVDKCLILFMVVLLVQSAYSLFAHGGGMTQSNEIDVIVRTAAASIFGYFLSANFIRRDGEKKELGGEALDMEVEEESVMEEDEHSFGNGSLQILAASGIGLFCLMTLIILRDFGALGIVEASASGAATVTQFRDFVSGCVGFLIGCPTSEKSGERR